VRALVLGAGPSGLAAAQALLDAGVEVTLLEASEHVGGLAGSRQIGGHRVDLGPHRLHQESSAEVRALVGGDEGLLRRQRLGCIHLDGCSVPYPLQPLPTLRALGPRRAADYFAGVLSARLSPRGEADSYAVEARRRVGQPLYRALYENSARKVWGVPAEALDGAQARARVGAEGARSLLSRLFAGGSSGHYLYPKAGASGLAYAAWTERLQRRGLVLLRGARAVALARGTGTELRVRAHTSRGSQELCAERVISSLPLTALCAALDSPAAATAARGLRFRSVVLLHLVVSRSRLHAEDVHYFPDLHTPFARLTEQKAFGSAPGTPAQQSALTLDFYDDPGGPLVTASAEQLFERAAPRLSMFGIERKDVLAMDTTVAHNAYPVLDRGHRVAREKALDEVAKFEGLLTTGRGGLLLHINQHHAIETGLAAGRHALTRGAVSRVWRQQARRFEEFRIVD